MEKLTRILAVVDKVEDGPVLLEKSVALARRFGAQVDLLLHESLHATAFATLCSTLHYKEVALANVHMGSLPLHELILRYAAATRPDVILKAAGANPLRRWTVDGNDSSLASESPVPLMLVRHKAWSKPVRFAAAVDVSDDTSAETARGVLHTAGFLALGFHGLGRCERIVGQRADTDVPSVAREVARAGGADAGGRARDQAGRAVCGVHQRGERLR